MINKAAIKYIEPRMNNGKYSNEQLALRIQAGENEAENMFQLWKQNKGYIANVARKFSKYAEMEELEQEGYIALCNAVQGYKHEQGMSFINYAAFYMHRQFERCANNNRSVPLPFGASGNLYKYKKIYAQFLKAYQRKPTDREMQNFLGVNNGTFASIKSALYSCNTESIEKPVAGEEEELTLGDMIASPTNIEEDCIERLDREAMGRELWIAVDQLPGDCPVVIRKRYKERFTMKEVGEDLQVSVEKVREVERRAMRLLRLPNRCGKFRRYYEEYLAAAPVIRVGIQSFNRTWMSATELAAIRNYERSRNIDDELNAILKEADAALEAIKSGTFSALWSNG